MKAYSRNGSDIIAKWHKQRQGATHQKFNRLSKKNISPPAKKREPSVQDIIESCENIGYQNNPPFYVIEVIESGDNPLIRYTVKFCGLVTSHKKRLRLYL